MTKGERLRADRARQRNHLLTPPARPRPGEKIDTAFLPGATLDNPEAIQAMQKQTHDGLIKMVGVRRRSGVRWHHIRGAVAGHKFLDEAYPDAPDGLDQFRAFLDEHRGRAVLVVATCDCAVPR